MKRLVMGIKSLQVYRFVVEYHRRHGYAPSYREIAQAVGLASPSTVAHHVKRLVAAGYLQRVPYRPRSVARVEL